VPKIFSLHVMQSSMPFAHSSQATKCRHGRNNVCTRLCLHFRQVISERNRSFSFLSCALSETHASTANVQKQSLMALTGLAHCHIHSTEWSYYRKTLDTQLNSTLLWNICSTDAWTVKSKHAEEYTTRSALSKSIDQRQYKYNTAKLCPKCNAHGAYLRCSKLNIQSNDGLAVTISPKLPRFDKLGAHCTDETTYWLVQRIWEAWQTRSTCPPCLSLAYPVTRDCPATVRRLQRHSTKTNQRSKQLRPLRLPLDQVLVQALHPGRRSCGQKGSWVLWTDAQWVGYHGCWGV